MKANELSMIDLDRVSGGRDFSGAIDRMQAALDNSVDIGESTALRLQMAMDRSLCLGPLSNFLKQIGGTQSAITQNLR
jgi:hypothetical protein